MSEIQGTYRDGHVELTAPVDWPEGTSVTVQPKSLVPQAHPANDWRENWGIDDDWPDTPENRAEILRRIDAVEPLEMTPEEQAEWHAMLDWFGEYTRGTDGQTLIVAPTEETTRKQEFRASLEETNKRYGKALKRLAQ